MTVVGLDVVRCFELSWLNSKGKPEVACMELCIALDAGKNLDTIALKEFLNSLTAQSFVNKETYYAAIENFLETSLAIKPVRLTFKIAAEFCNQDLTLHSTAEDHLISNTVRFICDRTSQPYTGSILADFIGATNYKGVLQQKIRDLRRHTTNPREYAAALLTPDSVISIHLARKGGISLQLLRSSDPEVDLWPYVQRVAVE